MKTLYVTFLAALSLGSAQAGIIFQAEAPGVQSTTVSGVMTEAFNLLPTENLGYYVSPLGDYTNGAAIVDGDDFGGANGTNYISAGYQSNTNTYSLQLAGPTTFFGLYWLAADAHNEISFYRNNAWVASFTTADVFGALPNAYYGNPNNGLNAIEPFAYINFFAVDGASFDRISFTNAIQLTGFESDNHSIYASSGLDPIGATNPVPEPSTYLLTGSAILGYVWKRRQKA